MHFSVFVWCVVITRVIGVVGGAEFTTTPACCPEGWSLVKISMGLLQADRYDCINSNSTRPDDDSVEVFENTAPVYGYRIRGASSADNGSVPRCGRPVLVFVSADEELPLPPRTCLASVDNRMVAISCPPQSDEALQPLSAVHKCCPRTHQYDAVQRKCAQRSNSMLQHYDQLFRHPVIFIDQPVDCPKDKALVEYRLRAEQFRFEDGQLELSGVSGAGARQKFELNDYCIEAIDPPASRDDVEFLVRTCNAASVCNSLPCIRRCCADGEMFTKGNATSYCKKDTADLDFHSFESLEISGNFTKPPGNFNSDFKTVESRLLATKVFGILRSLDCLKFRLDPDSYVDEMHTISSQDGSLFVTTTIKHYTNSQYCVEKTRNATWGDQKLYTFLCFDSNVVGNDRIRFKMYPIGLLISCSFYAMTLVVYLSISKLRNLPGRILICLVSSLFTAYLSIALGQLMPTPNDHGCFASGFFIYFCLMAAFAWMNVMCFDIWQTFGSAKKKHGFQEKQTKRFLLYSLYGWGLPTLLTFITVSLARSDILSESIKPHFGHGRCWFTYDTFASANLLFFSGPVGVLFLINFVLFSLTLRYCNRVKREIFRMQSSNMEKPILRRRFFMDKARFAMNTKLFIVMGITWFLELLSIVFYDHKQTFFWVISDSFNVLLGVFVFFIFVFKKRVWHSILVKLGLRSRESFKTAPNATYATQSTYARSISMTRLNTVDPNLSLLANAARN